jgi:hypothetical protein
MRSRPMCLVVPSRTAVVGAVAGVVMADDAAGWALAGGADPVALLPVVAPPHAARTNVISAVMTNTCSLLISRSIVTVSFPCSRRIVAVVNARFDDIILPRSSSDIVRKRCGNYMDVGAAAASAAPVEANTLRASPFR